MKSVLIIGDSLVQGVGSDTAEKVYARWPDKAYDLVLLQVGVNDSCHRRHKDGPETSPERFAKYLARIHERFRPPSTARLVMVGLFGVDETRTNPFGPEKSYTKDSLNLYDALIGKFARRHQIDLVSLRARPIKPSWLFDGLHPTDQGHAWIASHVIKALRPMTPAPEGLGEILVKLNLGHKTVA